MKPTNTSVDVRQMAFDLTFEQEAPHGAILKPESIVIVTLPRVVMDDPLPAPEKVKSVFDLFFAKESHRQPVQSDQAQPTFVEEKINPNVVKIVGSPMNGGERLRALYFTRATAPYGDGPLYHHIGLYAYRRAALERFVKIGPSPLEKREKLEQLRALEDGMRIEAEIVRTVPLGVDTQADLDRAREIIAKGL